jgi:ComF family protein
MNLFRRFLDLVLPTSCSFCNGSVAESRVPFFCFSCWSDFAVMSGPICPRCGRPFESPEALSHSPDHLCGACRRQAPDFDQALSAGIFEGPLREAIHQFKYRPCRSLGKPLARWMAGTIRVIQPIDLIVPIPLHSSRLRKRGFNQALLLAAELGKCTQLPLSFDNLVRIRPTRPQVELSGTERIKNVAGAFALNRPGAVLGRSILLIDDVFTTGATMNECARVLKKAGAAQVTAFTAARAF